MLTIAASAFGLLFATVAGMTAMALFLPAAVFIGGSLAAFSVLGSIFSLVGCSTSSALVPPLCDWSFIKIRWSFLKKLCGVPCCDVDFLPCPAILR